MRACIESVAYIRPALLVLLALISCGQLFSQSPVTVSTGQYNNSRTGANPNETILNTSNVNASQFGKVFTWEVDGWVDAQPLFVPSVTTNGITTSVVYVATTNNSIYAFDANNMSALPLWHTNLGPSVPAQSAGVCPAWATGYFVGIIGTPVIDTASNTIYAVSMSPVEPVSGQTPNPYTFTLNALDITTGHHKFGSPVPVQASVPGTGYDSVGGVVSLNQDKTHIQRTALLLSNGRVYMGFGNCGPDIDPWHGWLLGYDARTLKQEVVYNSTPNGKQGGIWMSGFGPVADAGGNLYFSTGNGDVGGNKSLADSITKLSPQGKLLDYSIPKNWQTITTNDLDLSSVGPLMIPNTGYLVAGGKLGVVYLLNSTKMRPPVQGFQATHVCAYPLVHDSTCFQMHGHAFWSDGGTGGLYYVWGGASQTAPDTLRVYSFQNGSFNPTPLAVNTVINNFNTDPALAISSNGNQPGTGILWVNTDPVLRAFDASNVANELWDSAMIPDRDSILNSTHWGEPTVAQGRVYYPFRYYGGGGIAVYGLLPAPPAH